MGVAPILSPALGVFASPCLQLWTLRRPYRHVPAPVLSLAPTDSASGAEPSASSKPACDAHNSDLSRGPTLKPNVGLAEPSWTHLRIRQLTHTHFYLKDLICFSSSRLSSGRSLGSTSKSLRSLHRAHSDSFCWGPGTLRT